MAKRTIALVLMLVLLLGMLPLSAVAQENEKCQVCAQNRTVYRFGTVGQTWIGQQLLSSGVDVAKEYPNNAPSYVDTASEKAAWVADQCRAKGITDPWQIALWLHDWLVYNANYDYTYSNYTADGVLLKGIGVCDSYTRAYNLLLQQFGFECIRLSSNAMDHAWNLVKIDGQWCHIDVTWDDPNEGGYENHFYFGLTDEMMSKDHDWNRNSSSYPPCTSDINFYPIRMGIGFKTTEEMENILNKKIDEREKEIELFYLGDDPNFQFYDALNAWYQSVYWDYEFNSCTFLLNVDRGVVYVNYPGDYCDHDYVAIKQPPYCTSEGYTIYICNKCNDQYTEDYVPALGHTGGVATCQAKAVCTRCGKEYGELGDHSWTNSSCTAAKTCTVCGLTQGSTSHVFDSIYDYKCNVCGEIRAVDMTRPMVDMFRMYDPNSGEHFYTGSEVEKNNLIAAGWKYEGVGFTFPLTTGDPVHRLYDPATGEHLYTMDVAEMSMLLAQGWNYEGIAFNSGFENEVPQYRLHNPNATRGAYHFTASEVEKNNLIAAGWEYQGIGWYSLGA